MWQLIEAMHKRVKAEQLESLQGAIATLVELQETYGCDDLYDTMGITSGAVVDALESLCKTYLKSGTN